MLMKKEIRIHKSKKVDISIIIQIVTKTLQKHYKNITNSIDN